MEHNSDKSIKAQYEEYLLGVLGEKKINSPLFYNHDKSYRFGIVDELYDNSEKTDYIRARVKALLLVNTIFSSEDMMFIGFFNSSTTGVYIKALERVIKNYEKYAHTKLLNSRTDYVVYKLKYSDIDIERLVGLIFNTKGDRTYDSSIFLISKNTVLSICGGMVADMVAPRSKYKKVMSLQEYSEHVFFPPDVTLVKHTDRVVTYLNGELYTNEPIMEE